MTAQLLDADIASYKDHGYHLAQGLLDRSEVDAILEQGMSLVKTSKTPSRLMNPHSKDDLFMHFFRHEAIVRTIEQIVDEQAVGVQTMFYIKPPLTSGHTWHQDQYYLAGHPKPVLAAWCALDDIDEENGALIVYPGSHRLGLLEMKPHSNPDFEAFNTAVDLPADIKPVTVRMKPGDVLLFDGLLIHGSKPNRSATRYRRAFVSHYLATGSSGAWMSKGNRPIALHG